jgi:hypothetical protein
MLVALAMVTLHRYRPGTQSADGADDRELAIVHT